MSKVRKLDELQSNIIAKKLATFVPSSLSIDDLKLGKKNKNPLKNSNVNSLDSFIPPSPSVSSIGKKNEQEKKTESVSKFAFLLGSKTPRTKKSISISKMKYELPNVQKIGIASKNLKPILAISLSTHDFRDGKVNVKAETQKFLPEAIQIESDFSDSGEE
jgi:hypothetical protein